MATKEGSVLTQSRVNSSAYFSLNRLQRIQINKKERDIVKKRLKSPKSARKNLPGLSIVAIVLAIPVFAIGAITVVSKQDTIASRNNHERSNRMPNNVPTIKVIGQDGHIDSVTGQTTALTADEAQRMAAGLKELINESTDGLKPVHHADGSVSVDLNGRLQNVAVARINADGSISQSCINSRQAAALFFGIDPKLLQDAEGKSVPTTRPNPQ